MNTLYKENTKKDTTVIYKNESKEKIFDIEKYSSVDNEKKSEFHIVLLSLRPVKDTLPGMFGTFENLGIEFIKASLIKAGYKNVTLIDAHALDISDEEVFEKVIGFNNIQLLGFSPSCETVDQTLKIADKIKSIFPVLHMTIGGHHVTLSAKELIEKEKSINSVVIGEGEETIIELANHLLIGNKDYADIKGLVYREDGTIKINQTRELITDIDTLGFPDRSTISFLKNTKKDWAKDVRLLTSRGCQYGSCSFCTTPSIYGNSWRSNSPKHVVDEMEKLHKDCGVLFFWISDDQFINRSSFTKERARVIAEEILRRKLNIYFRIMCRVDDFDVSDSNEDKELIALLHKAGWRVALVGFESGSDKILKVYKKGATKDKNIKFAEFLRKQNITVQSGFIMFDPNNDYSDLIENADFLLKIGEARFLGNFVRKIRIFYGTQNYYFLREHKLISKEFDYRTNSFKCSYKYPAIMPFMNWVNEIYFKYKKHDDKIWIVLNIYFNVLVENLKLSINSSNEQGISDIEKLIAIKNRVEYNANHSNHEFFIKALNIFQNNEEKENHENLNKLVNDVSQRLKENSDMMYKAYIEMVNKYGKLVNYPYKDIEIIPNKYYAEERGRC